MAVTQPLRRVPIDFTEEAYDRLEEIARRKGTSVGDVIRDALRLESWYQDQRSQGNQVLVKDKRNGRMYEVNL